MKVGANAESEMCGGRLVDATNLVKALVRSDDLNRRG